MKDNSDNNVKFINKFLENTIKKHERDLSALEKTLKSLDSHQILEWSEINERKCYELYEMGSTIKKNALFQQIVIYLKMKELFGFVYNEEEMERIIKEAYEQENREKISNSQLIKQFKSVEYATGEYEVLVYEDPWYSKIFNFFTD